MASVPVHDSPAIGAPAPAANSPTVDARRVPRVSAAVKLVGSFVGILFSIAAFIIPSGFGRLYAAVVAAVFATVGMLRPAHPRVGLKLFSWLAAALVLAALFAAVLDITNGWDGPRTERQIQAKP